MSQVQTKSRIRESASRAEIHSCVVEKLSHYAPLSDSEARLISRLEERPRTFKANEVICGSGEELGSLFIVREGRAYTYQILGDGRRQILQLYYPGDIIGTRDIVFEQCTASTVGRIRGRRHPGRAGRADHVGQRQRDVPDRILIVFRKGSGQAALGWLTGSFRSSSCTTVGA